METSNLYQVQSDIAHDEILNLFHQNVRDLHAKLNLITVFLRGRNIILTLSKTHKQDTDNFKIFSILGYHYIGKSRTAGTGESVGFYISNKHDFVHRKNLELSKIESIWIETRIKKPKNILSCTTYRPPHLSLQFTDHFSNTFSTILSKATIEITLTEITLISDLNISYLNNIDHLEIKDIFVLHGLTEIIKSPTHYDLHHNSTSFIDLIFVKETSRVAKSASIPYVH